MFRRIDNAYEEMHRISGTIAESAIVAVAGSALIVWMGWV